MVAPTVITTSSQAWNIYGYDFGNTYVQDYYDWGSGDSFTCYTNRFGSTDLTSHLLIINTLFRKRPVIRLFKLKFSSFLSI